MKQYEYMKLEYNKDNKYVSMIGTELVKEARVGWYDGYAFGGATWYGKDLIEACNNAGLMGWELSTDFRDGYHSDSTYPDFIFKREVKQR